MFNLKHRLEYVLARRKIQDLPNQKLRQFFQENLFLDKSHYNTHDLRKNENTKDLYKEIMKLRSVSTFKLKTTIPHQEMLAEAQKLNSLFVDHRKDPNWGWKALTIHGTRPDHTEDYYVYGFNDRESANYQWTEIAEKCPVTTKWLKEMWPFDIFQRVRFVLLEPGAAILPHNDTDGERGFFAVNISLNQPFGCLMAMQGYGIVPWQPGEVRLMDIGLKHSVVNLSNENRYHMIIHGHADKNFEVYRDFIANSI